MPSATVVSVPAEQLVLSTLIDGPSSRLRSPSATILQPWRVYTRLLQHGGARRRHLKTSAACTRTQRNHVGEFGTPLSLLRISTV